MTERQQGLVRGRASLGKGTRHHGEGPPGNMKGVDMTTVEQNELDKHRALPQVNTLPAASPILIAEEQAAIQELLSTTLALAGYRTTVCAGRQAVLTWLDQITPCGDCPALLLLDLSLPDTHAANFLSHLRTHWHDACGVLPHIIVLT